MPRGSKGRYLPLLKSITTGQEFGPEYDKSLRKFLVAQKLCCAAIDCVDDACFHTMIMF